MTSWKKLALWLVIIASLAMPSCASYSVFKKELRIADLCLEDALKECPPLSEPTTDGFITAAQWGVEMKYCQLVHKILVECVKQHDSGR